MSLEPQNKATYSLYPIIAVSYDLIEWIAIIDSYKRLPDTVESNWYFDPPK